jgi:hypothetical protein
MMFGFSDVAAAESGARPDTKATTIKIRIERMGRDTPRIRRAFHQRGVDVEMDDFPGECSRSRQDEDAMVWA